MTVEPSSNGMGRSWWTSIVTVLVLASPGWGQDPPPLPPPLPNPNNATPLTQDQENSAYSALCYMNHVLGMSPPPICEKVMDKFSSAESSILRGLALKRVRSAVKLGANPSKKASKKGGMTFEEQLTKDGEVGIYTKTPFDGAQVVDMLDELLDLPFTTPPGVDDLYNIFSLALELIHEGLHAIQEFEFPLNVDMDDPSSWAALDPETLNRLKAYFLVEIEAIQLQVEMMLHLMEWCQVTMQGIGDPQELEKWATLLTKLRRRLNLYYEEISNYEDKISAVESILNPN